MDRLLRELVWQRAEDCCEYCKTPQEYDDDTFEIDHIIATSHGGLVQSMNLCPACFSCNSFKGTNLSDRDTKTKKSVALFNPRRHSWPHHFRRNGPLLVGRTPAGRATVATLRINLDHRVAYRKELIDEGVFPPD